MPSGGILTEIKWENPEVGSGNFYAMSNTDSMYDLGGVRINDDANAVDASGTMVVQKNPVLGYLSWEMSNDMVVSRENEVVNQLINSMSPTKITATNINGAVYVITGYFVGDIAANGNTSRMPVKIQGTRLQRI